LAIRTRRITQFINTYKQTKLLTKKHIQTKLLTKKHIDQDGISKCNMRCKRTGSIYRKNKEHERHTRAHRKEEGQEDSQ